MKQMKRLKQLFTILLLIIGYANVAQSTKQKPTEQSSKTQDSLSECITLDEMLKQIEARDKRLEAKNKQTNSESDVEFSDDYTNLMPLELVVRVTGFEASKANKMHPMQGMLTESLMCYRENGREIVIEKSASNYKRKVKSRDDFAKLMWVDVEADMESFLSFIGLDKHPELSKVNGVGESAYWNTKNQNLQIYYKDVSFMLQVIVSFDEAVNKEKTIALAKLIVEERIK